MKRTHIQLLIGLIISLVCLYLAFRGISLQETLQAIRLADVRWLVATVAFYGLGYIFRTLRWQILIQPIKPVPFKTLLKVLIVGFAANNVLPFRLGEILRAHLCGGQFGIPRMAALGSIVLERLCDMVSFIIVFALSALVYPFPENVKRAASSMGIVAALLIVLLILCVSHEERFRKWLKHSPLPEFLRVKIDDVLANFLQGASGMLHAKRIFLALVLSLGVWWVEGTFLYGITQAFSLDFQYPQAFFVLFFLAMAVALPQAPGYVGTMEFFGTKAFELLGFAKEQGLPIILVAHGLQFLFLSIAGLTAWLLLGGSRQSLLPTPEKTPS